MLCIYSYASRSKTRGYKETEDTGSGIYQKGNSSVSSTAVCSKGQRNNISRSVGRQSTSV